MELCTIFDNNYLLKGLTLYESIKSNNILLNVLCIDKVTYETLNNLNLSNVKLYDLNKIEEENPDLLNLKNSRFKSLFRDVYANYCWSLSGFFCNFLLKTKNIESLLYIDSDIFFYENFDLILEEVKDKSVGIITHRKEFYLTHNTPNGKYNVGIIFFRNDENGYRCSEFWKNLLLNPDNEYSKEYGTCGDQKYLELFELKFKGVHVIDKLVGHGAPWCFDSCTYEDKYNIIYRGIHQKLVFNHFSLFKFEESGWKSSPNREWNPENINNYIREYYEDYYNEMLKVKKKYNL